MTIRVAELWHDSAGARVSLLSTATIGSWDRRRFRPNVLLDGEDEDALVGSSIALGDAVLDTGDALRVTSDAVDASAAPA